VLVVGGVQIGSPALAVVAIPLTVLWVVGITNAFNLLDNIDGLSAGTAVIASIFLFAFSVSVGNVEAAVLSLALAGGALGFLIYNFNPARIFMGDGGALLLGLLMAASTIVVGGRASPDVGVSGQTYFFFAPLVIPLVILGVPILDMLFAIIRRASRRRGLATADKDHLHHRLMRLGHGQRRSVVILWLWTAILSGFVLYPAYNHNEGNAVVPLGVAALGLALYTILHPQVRRARDDVD
jgi:UDP-GlcNAc:undecaprenyl-phosphate GlcNAc-1-phosphate transferase